MITRQAYIDKLKSYSESIQADFSVRSMTLFGSVARNSHSDKSDVDICVDMPPKLFLTIRLKRYLENILDSSVDIVRIHTNMNPTLKEEIERDGILLF